MNIPYVMKKCNKCGRWLVANSINFRKHAKNKYKLYSLCRECDKAYKKKYNEAHSKYRSNYAKEYRKTAKGQASKLNEHVKRRSKEQQGDGITAEQWLEIMDYFNWKCAYSGVSVSKREARSVDHIVPLNTGGKHEVWNLVPMVRNLNSSKNDRDMLEWYKQQDFFSEERLAKIREWQEYAYKKYSKKIVDIGKNWYYTHVNKINKGDVRYEKK